MWSLYCDLSATLWKWSLELLILHTNIVDKHSTITGTGIVHSRVVKNRIQPVNITLCGHYCLYYAYSRCAEKINKEQIINNMPSANWIKCCIPFFFELPEIITECQCCTKCL